MSRGELTAEDAARSVLIRCTILDLRDCRHHEQSIVVCMACSHRDERPDSVMTTSDEDEGRAKSREPETLMSLFRRLAKC